MSRTDPAEGKRRPKIRLMSRTLFYYILLVALIVLFFTSALNIWVMYSQYSRQQEDNMNSELSMLVDYCNTHGGYRAAESLNTDRRITIIASDGHVLYDNQMEADKLSSHKDRPEFREAMENGKGFSERRSSTLSRQSMYAAAKLKDGNVLRLSGTRYNMRAVLRHSIAPVLSIVAGTAILALLLARNISRTVTEPINKINLENPVETEVYKELQPLTERLEEQNKQIAQNIEEMQRQHDEQDKIRQLFTANVTHEQKTPLTSISGYAELMEMGIAKEEDIPRFAGVIHKESQRLITLVGDIIKLSQMDENEVAVVKENIDLWDTCESVLDHLHHAAQKKNVRLHLVGEHATIYGVAQIVEEMIFNLCDNAIKYNRDGGSVRVMVMQYVDGVEVSVKDTGIGIPEEDLPHIFERFYRVDKSHSKAIGGTGLGLSIVKHGAQYMGATLSVDSVEGEGTTFRILF